MKKRKTSKKSKKNRKIKKVLHPRKKRIKVGKLKIHKRKVKKIKPRKRKKKVKKIIPKILNKSKKNIRIKIVGVGGAGGNVITRMKEKRIEGVEFIAINTDIQGLHYTKAACRGLGAGMDPLKGREAAEENAEDINKVVQSSDLTFVTCGLGGGTGSGAAPLVANLAKQAGSLVVAVVTKPFNFEGSKRREIAEESWQRLFEEVDAIVTIPNDRVFNVIEKDTPILKAFRWY